MIKYKRLESGPRFFKPDLVTSPPVFDIQGALLASQDATAVLKEHIGEIDPALHNGLGLLQYNRQLGMDALSEIGLQAANTENKAGDPTNRLHV